jgi:hypothetical protein
MYLGSLASLDELFPQTGKLSDVMFEGIWMCVVEVLLDV